MKTAFIAAASFLGATDAKLGWGACPEIKYMINFNQRQFQGKWYEIFRDTWNIYTIGAECVTKEFVENEERNLDLYFRGSYPIVGYTGIAGQLTGCNSGQCLASMGKHGGEGRPFDLYYTDYKNFEIYYKCHEYLWGLFKLEDLAINSRTRTMDSATQARVRKIIEIQLTDYNMDSGMHWTEQDDRCVYEWEFDGSTKTDHSFGQGSEAHTGAL